jgi:hypothetical protein
MFMQPKNAFPMEDALLSLLAGDINGRSPIGPSLLAFKAAYLMLLLSKPRVALQALKRRKLNSSDATTGTA